MARKSENKSSRRYGSEGRRTTNKIRTIEREVKKAQARIRHIKSRVEREKISAECGERLIERQNAHIETLKARRADGFSNRR